MSRGVRTQVSDGVALLVLDRPDRMNAFDASMHESLRENLDAIEANPAVRALVISGEGRGFCAGQDLAERAEAFSLGELPDLGRSLEENYNPLIRRLANVRFPVIAAVNGVASGAGAALAIACDIVVAGESASFQFAFVRVGLGPDAGTSWHLPRRVGHARALALSLTGEAIDAQRALAIGLCDAVHPDGLLIDAAQSMARALAAGPEDAIRAIRHCLRASPPNSLEEAFKQEADQQARLGRHDDYREAVTAFAAKRRPKFERGQIT